MDVARSSRSRIVVVTTGNACYSPDIQLKMQTGVGTATVTLCRSGRLCDKLLAAVLRTSAVPASTAAVERFQDM